MPYYRMAAARELSEFFPPMLAPRSIQRIVNRGMGATGVQLASSIAATGASTTVGILVSLGALGGPAGAAIAGLIGIGTAIAGLFHGCGQTCVISSDDANKVGDYLTQNLNHYLSAPVHYKSLQLAALNNFDTGWQALTAACSNPQLGSAGQRCISDRQQGACKWKASPGGWSQVNGKWTYQGYGPAGSGSACWNYFVGMRDPIADDPTVVPDPLPTSSTTSQMTGGPGAAAASAVVASPSWLIPGALAGLGLLLYFGSKN